MPSEPHSNSPHRDAVHLPVMLREVLRSLDLKAGLTVVDGTVGAGGHSQHILPLLSPGGKLVGIDRDPMMLEYARKTLEKVDTKADFELFQGSYARLPEFLEQSNLQQIDRVLLDLGLSSDQLADDTRGFSFNAEGPLDLRFDPTEGKPASELLLEWSEEELTEIFEKWGEEKFSRQIASTLVTARNRQPVTTSSDLVEIVLQAIPGTAARDSRKHPATRVFQALRIAVNAELQQLDLMLEQVLPEYLASDGLAVIITFHSLEDRMVKNAFRNPDVWENLTPKPIEPTRVEQKVNPRSRSAKIRIGRRK